MSVTGSPAVSCSRSLKISVRDRPRRVLIRAEIRQRRPPSARNPLCPCCERAFFSKRAVSSAPAGICSGKNVAADIACRTVGCPAINVCIRRTVSSFSTKAKSASPKSTTASIEPAFVNRCSTCWMSANVLPPRGRKSSGLTRDSIDTNPIPVAMTNSRAAAATLRL